MWRRSLVNFAALESFKIPRVVRSSLAAETCACTGGEDQLEFVKLFYLEMLHARGLDLRKYTTFFGRIWYGNSDGK